MGKKTDRGSADTELDLIRREWMGLNDPPLHGPMSVERGKIKNADAKTKGAQGENTSLDGD